MSNDENSSLEVAMAPTSYLLWLSKSNLWLSAIFRYPILNLADTLIMGHNLWLKGPGIWSLAQTCFGGSSDRESGTTGSGTRGGLIKRTVLKSITGRFAKLNGLEIKKWPVQKMKLDGLLKNSLVFSRWVHFWTKLIKRRISVITLYFYSVFINLYNKFIFIRRVYLSSYIRRLYRGCH